MSFTAVDCSFVSYIYGLSLRPLEPIGISQLYHIKNGSTWRGRRIEWKEPDRIKGCALSRRPTDRYTFTDRDFAWLDTHGLVRSCSRHSSAHRVNGRLTKYDRWHDRWRIVLVTLGDTNRNIFWLIKWLILTIGVRDAPKIGYIQKQLTNIPRLPLLQAKSRFAT